ncbi:MAG: DUF1801 domain-containing protein [Patescibacteria group bacterium]|jgi:uncharacterized protein YdhG (YjbR/CyaY superfamily)
MNSSSRKFVNIDEYIALHPKNVQIELKKLRQIIIKAAPGAEEAIRYDMPTFRINDASLVHFAAYAKHIGFYPTPSGVSAFKKELSKFRTSKGAIQFPIEKALPLGLIAKIVRYRVKESLLIK